jgi:hypothetical protein
VNVDFGARQVWIIAPEAPRESRDQAALRKQAMILAQDSGIVAITRRTKRHIIAGGPEAHKRFELVEPRDAGDLYRAIHRYRVLVLAVAACFVRSDPAEAPTRKRHARRLEEFVRYKAAYGLARGAADPAAILAAFARWPSECGSCADSGDPRVLPLHVFDKSRVWPDLDDSNGLFKFGSAYGTDSRTDADGQSWSRARALHGGRTPLAVSGLVLPRGFHWDVQRNRGVGRLTTSDEVWKLNSGGYANVYPDAHVRVGKKYGRRVWLASVAENAATRQR